MEVIIDTLIFREYDEAYLKKNYTINTLKDENMEWNKEDNKSHKYSEDIKKNDIAISVRDINSTEDYMYFFFTMFKKTDELFIYTIQKAVIDKNMPKNFIRKSVEQVLKTLNNGTDNLITRLDRLFVRQENHPFHYPHIEETTKKVADEIVREFLTGKTGFAQFTPKFEEKLMKSAKNNKNASE